MLPIVQAPPAAVPQNNHLLGAFVHVRPSDEVIKKIALSGLLGGALGSMFGLIPAGIAHFHYKNGDYYRLACTASAIAGFIGSADGALAKITCEITSENRIVRALLGVYGGTAFAVSLYILSNSDSAMLWPMRAAGGIGSLLLGGAAFFAERRKSIDIVKMAVSAGTACLAAVAEREILRMAFPNDCYFAPPMGAGGMVGALVASIVTTFYSIYRG